mmetsp:Transcript_5048/g.14491  ORF Transcript_5048/g.14491 Transcript_5048/m.14491 type:complete len:105 (-) Transcript_5048:959-1273(-)
MLHIIRNMFYLQTYIVIAFYDSAHQTDLLNVNSEKVGYHFKLSRISSLPNIACLLTQRRNLKYQCKVKLPTRTHHAQLIPTTDVSTDHLGIDFFSSSDKQPSVQ